MAAAAAVVIAVAAGAPNDAKAALIKVGFLLDSSGSIGASGWSTIVNGTGRRNLTVCGQA